MSQLSVNKNALSSDSVSGILRLAYRAVLNREISDSEISARASHFTDLESLIRELVESREYAEQNGFLDANRKRFIELIFMELLGRRISDAELRERLANLMGDIHPIRVPPLRTGHWVIICGKYDNYHGCACLH